MTRRLAPQGSANLRAGPARGRTCGGVGLAVPRGPDRQSAALRAQLCLDCRRASPLGLRFLGFPQAPANPPLTPSGQRWAGLGAAHLGVSPQPVRVKFENRLRAPKAPEKAASSCFGGAARGCGFFFFPCLSKIVLWQAVFRAGRDFVGNSRVRVRHFVDFCDAFELLKR